MYMNICAHIYIYICKELNMTNKTNLKSLDILMLDILFDFTNNAYQPYRKPNNELAYINNKLNHPPTIFKELPKSINR